ncbi:hypothetical protein BDY24DRAFT_443307 [Mrakia frigida]|uniref:uncharacterized protein n=1 Tax=Mrakia frigida TaxID=29902 RepID=UPI003FCC26B8
MPTTTSQPTWSSIARSAPRPPERRAIHTAAPFPIVPSSRSTTSRPLPPPSTSNASRPPPPTFHFASDFDSFGSLSCFPPEYTINQFPDLPIVDPLPHLYHDPPPVPSPPTPPPRPLVVHDPALVGRRDGRVLVTGWVEENEVGRLLGKEEESCQAIAKVPVWEEEDALVKQRDEEFECPVSDPHIINCGHMFCLSCIQSISTKKCPLCRTRFSCSFPNLFAKQALSRYRNERVA